MLEKSIGDGDPEKSSLDLFSLEMFENIAYVMAKHADPSIPDNPEEWLDEYIQYLSGSAEADRAVGNEHQDGCGG